MIKKIISIVLALVAVSIQADVNRATLINKTGREIAISSIEKTAAHGCTAGNTAPDKSLQPDESYVVDLSGLGCIIVHTTFGYQGGSGMYTTNSQVFPAAYDAPFQDPKGNYHIIDCGNDSFSLVSEISGLTTCGTVIPAHKLLNSESAAKDYAEDLQADLSEKGGTAAKVAVKAGKAVSARKAAPVGKATSKKVK